MDTVFHILSGGICSFLFGFSLLILFIQFRSRIDESLLPAGLLIFVLCLFCGLDIWVHPDGWDMHRMVAQHMLIPYAVACSFWSALTLANDRQPVLLGIIGAVSTAVSTSFLSGLFFTSAGGMTSTTVWYRLVFVPYIAGVTLIINGFLWYRLKLVVPERRTMVRLCLIGYLVLFASGIVDMVNMMRHTSVMHIDSFLVIGALVFGIIMALLLTNRLLMITEELQVSYGKIRQAYTDLEDAANLKRLGMSVAVVAHEFKNYTYSLGGLAGIISKRAGEPVKVAAFAEQITAVTGSMMRYCKDVLFYSATQKAPREFALMDLASSIDACLQRHLPRFGDRVRFNGLAGAVQILADHDRLENVWMNLLNNAFDAGSTRVDISIATATRFAVVSIEDDGSGCTPEQFEKLFSPFYTTKRHTSGTGLGLVTCRSLVEIHGGTLHGYARNALGIGAHGFTVTVTLPLVASGETETTGRVCIVSDGLPDPAAVARPIASIGIIPFHEGLSTLSTSGLIAYFAAPDVAAVVHARNPAVPVYCVETDDAYKTVLVRLHGTEQKAMLTEFWVADALVSRRSGN